MDMHVEIYGTPHCTFCKQAVKLCEANNLEMTYIDLSTAPEQRPVLEERVGGPVRTVPQIFVDGLHLPGGFMDLKVLV